MDVAGSASAVSQAGGERGSSRREDAVILAWLGCPKRTSYSFLRNERQRQRERRARGEGSAFSSVRSESGEVGTKGTA